MQLAAREGCHNGAALQEENFRPDPLAQAIATLVQSNPEKYIDHFNFRSEICISCDWRRMDLNPKVSTPCLQTQTDLYTIA